MASVIRSVDSCAVVLGMNTYQSCRLWLNGGHIYDVEWKRARSLFREEFVPVKLKGGRIFWLSILEWQIASGSYRFGQIAEGGRIY